MLNGKKELVDKFIHWLETRMFYLPFENPNLSPTMKGADGSILARGIQPLDGSLRYGMFGTWEFVFPKEHMNEVLTTLNFHVPVSAENYPGKMKMMARLKAIRTALALEPIPDFKTDKELLLPEGLKEHIRIVPLGVRYDAVRKVSELIHEAL